MLRITVVEMDGDSGAMQEVLRAFAGTRANGNSKPAVAPAVTAAAAIAPRALPTARAKKADPATPMPKGAVAAACLEAIHHGPCSTGEIKRFVAAAGVKNTSVDQILFTLRKANRIYKGEDLLWNLAEKPESVA